MNTPEPIANRPLVSVVMIFFQAERFIAEAIESVLTQTWPRWELVLVDDGSSDGGSAIAQGYVQRFPDRIRCLQHPGGKNRGMAASRNLGMKAARGSVFAFLDSDDVWMPHRLERHLELLARMPRPAVVIGSDLYWYSWAERTDAPAPDDGDRVVVVGVSDGAVFDPPDLLELMLRPRLAATPGICSITFDRGAAGPPLEVPPQFVATFEDQCICAILLADRPALVIDEPLAKYRQHPWSSTAQARRAGKVAADGTDPFEAEYLEWLKGHLIRERRMTPALERAFAERAARSVGTAWLGMRAAERRVHRLALAILPRPFALAIRSVADRIRESLRRRRIRKVERTRC